MANKRSADSLKAIRWDVQDWEMLATIAKRVGLTRSAFVKRAALGEAGLILAGAAPHFVGPSDQHNGGAKTFSAAKQTKRRVPEEHGASAGAKRRPADERAQPKPKAG